MSCNPVRLIVSTFFIVLLGCAAVSAQFTETNYHIYNWNENPDGYGRPGNTKSDFYFPYLQYQGVGNPPYGANGLYNSVPILGTYELNFVNATNIILYNNDYTLQNQFLTQGDEGLAGYYVADSTDPYQLAFFLLSDITIKSDKEGTPRTLRTNNSSLIQVASGASLTLTKDILINNSATPGAVPVNNYYGNIIGGIVLNTGGTVTAQNAGYSNNINTSTAGYGSVISSIASHYYDYYYDDDGYVYYENSTVLHRGTVNIEGTTFTANSASSGGAIALNESDLYANRAVFNNNGKTTNFDATETYLAQNGGAVYLTNHSTASLEQATFTHNNATQYGGAIYAQNSDLDVMGTNFRENTAGQKGGAVYFDANDGGSYSLRLGSFRDVSTEFINNTQSNGIEFNSITFTNSSYGSPRGIVNAQVVVEGASNNFNLRDPMLVVGPNQQSTMDANLSLLFSKMGEGAWNIYGDSNISRAAESVIDVMQGTFRLGDGAKLNMANGEGFDRLTVRKDATLAIGNSSAADSDATLLVSNLVLATGSTLRLDKTLNLDVREQGNIGGTLTGTGNLETIYQGDLTKKDEGVVRFTGKTSNYTGDLIVHSGEFWFDSASSFQTTGSVNFEQGTVLSVTTNSLAANVVARNIDIGNGNVAVNIRGVTKDSKDFTVLKSDNKIVGDFMSDPNTAIDVDYLQATFAFTQDRKEYKGSVQLTWNPSDSGNANGTFTVDPANGQANYFVVDQVLKDNTASGKTLTKKGRGTLELTQANEYRGGTSVENGTLSLTNAKATGSGTITVAGNAALQLNFNDNFDRQVSGEGKILKTGSETVTLTNTSNNYSGGTRLEEGKIAVINGKVLGTGTITFAGGILQIKPGSGEVSLTQHIAAEPGKDMEFETLGNLRIASGSTMLGEGGIHKTGNGKLTLAGTAAYLGATTIDEGTLALTSVEAIGAGKIVLADGVTIENTQKIANDRNITLNTVTDAAKQQGVFFNVSTDWNQTGSIDGKGELVKLGKGTLELSGSNSYSGGTKLEEGTLAFSSIAAFGTGPIIFDGGTLRNTKQIDNLALSMQTVNGKSFFFDTQKDLTLSSRLSGDGGLTKTGSATLTLTGNSDYRGETLVKTGLLDIDGELTRSKVTVESGAALTGSGTVYNDVNFKPGAVYQWDVALREEDSQSLNVKGTVNLRGAVFRPMTVTGAAQDSYPEVIDGWTVLKYGLLDQDDKFAYIDNDFSPFYDFVLDYDSTPNEVKITGYHRRNPRGLSDSVAMGLVIPQRKVYRRAFEQVDRELENGRYLGLRSVLGRRQQQQVRGQVSPVQNHLWADFYGRTSQFESSYHTNNDWKLNSFGLQFGYSFLSTNWLSLGVTAGVEFPEFRNGIDKIDASDGFIGLYAGTRIYGMWEFKGYIGGGAQDYTSFRSDPRYTYRAKYRGDSFETNIELGRPILFDAFLVRPHFGFDLEYAGQQGSVETAPSQEYRSYSNGSLTQLFFRVGIDTEKRTDWGNIFLGIDYANMIAGQSVPHVDVYYPAVKSGTTVRGTSLGQNIFSIRLGGNQYLDKARNKSFFVNVTTDIFADRAGGQAGVTATLGLDSRF